MCSLVDTCTLNTCPLEQCHACMFVLGPHSSLPLSPCLPTLTLFIYSTPQSHSHPVIPISPCSTAPYSPLSHSHPCHPTLTLFICCTPLSHSHPVILLSPCSSSPLLSSTLTLSSPHGHCISPRCSVGVPSATTFFTHLSRAIF